MKLLVAAMSGWLLMGPHVVWQEGEPKTRTDLPIAQWEPLWGGDSAQKCEQKKDELVDVISQAAAEVSKSVAAGESSVYQSALQDLKATVLQFSHARCVPVEAVYGPSGEQGSSTDEAPTQR